MKVILKKTVSNLGLVGDVVDVKPGYYRNYLSPRELALIASDGSIKQVEHQKKVIEINKVKERKVAQEIQKRLEAASFSSAQSGGAGDKIFGSVTNTDIAALLKEQGFEVDRRLILLESPLKTIGNHEVDVKLHPDVIAKIKVEITKKESSQAEEK